MSFDFTAFKKTKESVKQKLLDIHNQKSELQNKVEAIRRAPATKENIKTHVRTWVKDCADTYTKKLLEKTTRLAQSPVNSSNLDLRAFVTFGGATGPNGSHINQDFQPSMQEIGQAMCALLGPVVLDSLQTAIDGMAWPEGAIPMADREPLIAELSQKISKLIDEEDQIVSQASEAGLSLD